MKIGVRIEVEFHKQKFIFDNEKLQVEFQAYFLCIQKKLSEGIT